MVSSLHVPTGVPLCRMLVLTDDIHVTDCHGTVFVEARNPEGARAVLGALRTHEAHAAYEGSGLSRL